jgi:D-lactate dehydrogenase
MDVTVFGTKPYDRTFLDAAVGTTHTLHYLELPLTARTAVLAKGSKAVCAFVNDKVDAEVLEEFKRLGVGLVALRAAGFNNVDLPAAKRLGIAIARVPAYSPDAVAEHAVALILSLNRKTHIAYARLREGNFALDGLLGFNLSGRTVGIIGTGKIGSCVAKIMSGFGCKVLAYDLAPNPDCEALGVTYGSVDSVLAQADIVSLHCPLTPATRHLIDTAAIAKMKRGVMVINTSRGGIVDTQAVTDGLNSGAIGYLGLDVYEEEGDLFFEDLSDTVIHDDLFERLLMFRNVLVTGHQAFFTKEALTAIAETTIENITTFETTGTPRYAL